MLHLREKRKRNLFFSTHFGGDNRRTAQRGLRNDARRKKKEKANPYTFAFTVEGVERGENCPPPPFF